MIRDGDFGKISGLDHPLVQNGGMRGVILRLNVESKGNNREIQSHRN